MRIIDTCEKYEFTINPYACPVATVESGEEFEVVTEDAFCGKLRSESQNPETVVPYFNPVTGPIYVKGAECGDSLKISILSIEPRRDWGVSTIQGHFGALGLSKTTRILNDPLQNQVYIYKYIDGAFKCGERLVFSYKPFIGTIATSSDIEAVSSLSPFEQGGNMDVPDICPGHTIYLPVRKQGAFLYIGDCHARQGQGEACGTALEIAANVRVRVEVIKNKTISWPRVESEDSIMCIGNARPMEDAARIAFCEMVEWMVEEFGWEKMQAYQAITMAAEAYIGNACDSAYSVVVKMNKGFVCGSKIG